MKIIKKIAIKKKIFSVDYFLSKEIILDKKDYLVGVVNDITIDSWGNPGKLGEKWVDLADIILVARDDSDREVAFAMGNYLKKDVVVLVATAVREKNKNSGIGTALNFEIIKISIQKRIRESIFSVFLSHYFVFRTPNPTLYSLTSAKVPLFPGVEKRSPSKKELEIFDLIVEKFTKNAKVDKDNFVIFNSLKEYSDLIYKKDFIPWSRDEKVNNLFEKSLDLTKQQGNTMVIIGKINPVKIILFQVIKTLLK